MSSKNKVLLFCAIVLQIGLVLSVPVIKEINIRTGKTIVVKTIPIDPQSFFRGDYVNLGYEFSRIDLNTVQHDDTYFYNGNRVFVILSPIANSWQAVWVGSKPPKAVSPSQVVLIGSVSNWSSGDFINVVYGIESYFVPEGKGKDIEKNIRDRRATVELSIDKKGFASVRKIFIDDQEVKFR